MSWFKDLTGFEEVSYLDTQSKFVSDGGHLTSLVNGRSWKIGDFEMVPLSTLRERVRDTVCVRGKPEFSVVTGDVRKLHADSAYAGALFQVASQFNALEMTGPNVTPEDGVTRYQNDHTQGPACAMAAGAATIFRNYFVPVDGGLGQTKHRQLNGLVDIGAALSADLQISVDDLWVLQNGYALCRQTGLEAISARLGELDVQQVDELRGRLAVAVQRNTVVTEGGAPTGQLVSQIFCSALPVSYSNIPSQYWRLFAKLVLDAAYEATLWEAVLNAAGGSNIVLLTLLGGGAFGNESEWIYSAIQRALERVSEFNLDVRIVSYVPPSRELLAFVERLRFPVEGTRYF